ncbi:glycosyl hydrolase [Kitasatospora sp. NPDC098663]|uniref:glycosyl hydrolase n=1 Tax=Kitasatospora sp. NPDC098663 TaxID=3364096 RepID=UPI0038176E9D
MTTYLDFDIDGLEPADDQTEDQWRDTWGSDYQLLARHDIGERTFVVAFDSSATWREARNLPNIATFDVQRDQAQGTFTMDSSAHANVAFAQKWLVDRGCPPEATRVHNPFKPADDLTTRVEEQIHRSGDRYALIEVMAADENPDQAWTMATDKQATELPVRVFVEQTQPGQGTYTVREGAFADYTAAEDWQEEQDTPLPEPPEYHRNALRTRAALARSTTAPAAVTVAAVLASAPAAAAVAQPDRGRSL